MKKNSPKKTSYGSLFMEAAILLPFGFAMLLGISYFSRLYLFRMMIANSAAVIARAIQDQPNISAGNMNQVVNGAFSNLQGTARDETKLGIKTFNTWPPTPSLSSISTSSVTSGGSVNTSYPHTSGGPGQPYWVAVVVRRDFPLANLIMGSSAAFTMNNYAVVRVAPPVPPGSIMMWSGAVSAIPSGWQLCNGTNGTPNLLNRFIVGGGTGSFYSVGDTGGANQVTLTEAQMPSHSHGIQYQQKRVEDTGWAMVSDLEYGGGDGDGGQWNAERGPGFNIKYTGGNEPHENRPPYYALAFIMKLP